MNTRRIVILGFMACGKTTVGTEYARQFNCGFADLDAFISKRQGQSPAEIIMKEGEPAFRELETLALRDVLQDRQVQVIALGGGTWMVPANRTILALYDCVTVWLDTPFEMCWERIANANVNRPLAPDRERAKILFDARRALYELADRRVTVAATNSVESVVEQILRET